MQILGGLHVGEDRPEFQHLGHVLELGEPCLHAERVVAGRGHLHLRDCLPERCRPRIERADSGGVEQVRAQVLLHHERFGDAVRDRCRGCAGDDPFAALGAQVFEFHVQIGGAPGTLDRGVSDVGVGGEVLVHVHLVHDHVVDAGVLEAHPGIPAGVDACFDLVLQLEQLALDALDAHRVLARRGGEHFPHVVDLGLDVRLLGLGAQRNLLERALRHEHAIPLVRRGPRDEQTALVGGEVFAGRGENPGLRIDLQPFAGELFQHVIRNHEHGLVDQPHAAHLHDAHDHFRRLARPDLVEQPGRGFGDHARDGGALVRARGEVLCQPRQAQVLARVGVVAQHDGVEAPVVLGHERAGTLRVFKHPLGEPLL